MPLYGSTIKGLDGEVSVSGCLIHRVAVEKVTDLAINSGWKPPKWWQIWLPRWPKACKAEYRERMNGKPGPT